MLNREAEIAAACAQPLVIADAETPALERTAPAGHYDEHAVARLVLSSTGIHVSRASVHYGLANYRGDRKAVIVATHFSPPREAKAEVTAVTVNRFSFSRATLIDAALWLNALLGVVAVATRIATDDHRAARFAKRVGFKPDQPIPLDDGRPALRWVMTIDEFWTSRWVQSPAQRKEARSGLG